MKYILLIIVVVGGASFLPIFSFTKYSYDDRGTCAMGECYYTKTGVETKGSLIDFINAKQQKHPLGIIVDADGKPIE